MKGVANSPDGAADWAGCKPDGRTLRMAVPQWVLSPADADGTSAQIACQGSVNYVSVKIRLFTAVNACTWAPG